MKVYTIATVLFSIFGLTFCQSQGNEGRTRVGPQRGRANTVGKDLTTIMDGWFVNYDNRVRPNIGEGPVQINISMYILDFINVDHIKGEFTVQLYLRQNWIDERLTYKAPEGITYIWLDATHSKKLWKPDTYFPEERRSKWHDVTTENELTRVTPDGKVLRSIRVTVTSNAPMDLTHFPFDTNTCSFQIESYSYTVEHYHYSWEVEEAKVKLTTTNAAVKMLKYLGQSATEYNYTLKTGTYSRLRAEFMFQRPPGRYIREVFFPIAALTFLTFTTLSAGSPQFRLLLSLVCLLGVCLLRIVSSDLIPTDAISEPFYLNCYLTTAYLMVFASILVNFFASQVHSRIPKSDASQPTNGEGAECTASSEPPQISSRKLKFLYNCTEMMKYILPIFYIVFNFGFWIILLTSSTNQVPSNFSL